MENNNNVVFLVFFYIIIYFVYKASPLRRSMFVVVKASYSGPLAGSEAPITR